jgi:hypothetical protein
MAANTIQVETREYLPGAEHEEAHGEEHRGVAGPVPLRRLRPREHVEADGWEELVLQELGDDPEGHFDAVLALQDGAVEVEREVADDDQEEELRVPRGAGRCGEDGEWRRCGRLAVAAWAPGWLSE